MLKTVLFRIESKVHSRVEEQVLDMDWLENLEQEATGE